MKGIVLAGGAGTRLYPVTRTICKQLLPVYNKPMIYYPISTLMLAGIRDILIISTPDAIVELQKHFGGGVRFGLNLSYAVQEQPNGIAEAFIIGESFIDGDNVTLILGDNLFYGSGLGGLLQRAAHMERGATIFGYQVRDPQRFGVAEVDENGIVLSIEEKPKVPKSNLAVVGLYIYDSTVCEKAKTLKPSDRGELEITDLNKLYLSEQNLSLVQLLRGIIWYDLGTLDSLCNATTFIKLYEERSNRYIACLEEIAYHNNFVSKETLLTLLYDYPESGYKSYIMNVVRSS